MKNPDLNDRALRLVNLARATYGALQLESLLDGQTHSAPFCPIGRSLRRGVEDWLFVTVGSRHLRLWAVGKDPAHIAKQIMTAWGIPRDQLKQSPERPGVVMFSLPTELSEFVNRFDQGLLPHREGRVDRQEVQNLGELASRMPLRESRNKARLAEASGRQRTHYQ